MGTDGVGRPDSVGALLTSPNVADAFERDAVFDEVARGLFATATSPRRIGRYHLGERLGGGGQGVVYAARDPELKRRVAIKILQVDMEVEGATARLRREAMALAQLSHPNVIAIHDVGVLAEGVFIVMQYVPGQTLSQWLLPSRSWRDVLDAFAAAGHGLVAAHRQGIVHRDFKPSNVWMGDDGVVRLLDFGLAQVGRTPQTDKRPPTHASDQGSQTAAGFAVGTPAYMAPEQHDGRPATEASDQYAYCVALYEALFARRPFEGSTLEALALAKRKASIPAAPRRSAVPGAMWRLLARGLQPEPTDRWPSMAALLEAMQLAARPRRRLRRFVLGASVFSGMAAIAWLPQDPETCDRDGDLSEIWSDDHRDRIKAAFAATRLDYAGDASRRALRSVDDYVSRWTAARAAACGRIGRDADADRTMRCLVRLRQDLATRIELLERATGRAVAHVDEIAGDIEAPASCAADRWQPTPDSESTYRAIRDARALGMAGKLPQALAAAGKAAAAAAHETTDDGLRAEASLVYGELLLAAKRIDAAIEELERAYLSAIASTRDRIAFDAALALVDLFASSRQDLEQCRTWVERATATLGRLDAHDDVLTGALALARAKQRFAAADYAGAAEDAQQAVTALGHAGDPKVVSALTVQAKLFVNMGHNRDAEQAVLEALAFAERERGAQHPAVVDPLMVLARMRGDPRNPGETLALYERARSVAQQTYGADDLRVAEIRRNIGGFHAQSGRDEDAVAEYRAVLAMQRSHLPTDDPLIAQTLYNLASSLRNVGELEEAAALGRESVRIADASIGHQHTTTAIYLHGLGETLQRTDPRAALELFEDGIEVVESTVGEGHFLHSALATSIGLCQRELGDLEAARTTLQATLSAADHGKRPQDPRTIARAHHELALVETALGARRRALEHRLEELEILEMMHGSDHPSIVPALEAIAEHHAALGRPRDATRVRARAESISARRPEAAQP